MKEESRAILEMIDDLQNRFEGLMIGYEYKENSITHFVKIKTESGGKLSKEISDYCFEFLMKFLEKTRPLRMSPFIRLNRFLTKNETAVTSYSYSPITRKTKNII